MWFSGPHSLGLLTQIFLIININKNNDKKEIVEFIKKKNNNNNNNADMFYNGVHKKKLE